ncbi:MAG: thiamine pyrophosphate-dependent enzyme [Eubacteriales bacterium]|nr:thiamine pyrophosphate-dependent enzyme [Eubacteriales bacterium]
MKLKAPETITFTTSGFCPGCGHGIAARLIAEIVEEMGLREDFIPTVDVACGALNMDAWRFDTVMAAHGRPIVTAIGVKKVRKDKLSAAYIGDGAAYAIGMAETMHAALRNDNVTVIVMNNGVFGMTGGQMAPTTLLGQKTTSSPGGRSAKKQGMPFDVAKVLGQLPIAYLARGSLDSPAAVEKTKKYIKKGFEKQMNGEGFSLIEVLAPCPTNWGLSPVESLKHIREKTRAYYEVGEFVDRKGEQA